LRLKFVTSGMNDLILNMLPQDVPGVKQKPRGTPTPYAAAMALRMSAGGFRENLPGANVKDRPTL